MVNGQYTKLSTMRAEAGKRHIQAIEDLADFIRRVRVSKNLSIRQVAKNSGGRIGPSYISQLENRYLRNPTPDKIRALARGLGIKEDDLFDVVRGYGSEGEDDELRSSFPYQIYQRMKSMTGEDKQRVEYVLRMLLADLDRA